jgi:hypothetical protein
LLGPAPLFAVRAAALKCLVEHPAALILDLRAVQDATASSASLWFALRRTAEGGCGARATWVVPPHPG